MKPAFHKEHKKFCLRHSRKPRAGSCLSGVVMVADSDGRGYCYVDFSDDLVVSVGKALPCGVSDFWPAFLKVVQLGNTDIWRMYACYKDMGAMVLLVEYSGKPGWLKKVRRAV